MNQVSYQATVQIPIETMFQAMKVLGIRFEDLSGVMPNSIIIEVHSKDYWQAEVVWTETNNE